MFTLMALFGMLIFAAVAVAAVALFAVAAKLILLPLRLLFLPLKLLALPFIAIALIVKFAFMIAIGSVVVALLIPLAILASSSAHRSPSWPRSPEFGAWLDSCVA